ncbi:MAG: SH3 domain-containing protein [Candidatus Rifleibacteriota bacterium]
MKKIFLLLILLLLVGSSFLYAVKMPSKGETTASALNVREGPGMSYDVLQTVPQGTVVTITGFSGNWYEVNVDGRTGVYVHSAYVKVTDYDEVDDPEAEKNATKRFMPTLSVVDPDTR